MITVQQLNQQLLDAGIAYFVAVDFKKVNLLPHPYCITGKHIERYHINTDLPCGMYVNADYTNWNSKKTKEYTEKCTKSFEEHTFELGVLLAFTRDVHPAQLNDDLGENGMVTLIFKPANIVGIDIQDNEFNFNESAPYK